MATEGDVASISVKFTSSDKAAGKVSISLGSTIGAFKEAIRSQFSVEPMRLIFQGRILNKDEQTLLECKLKDGLTVVVQAAPTAQSNPPPPAATAAASTTARSPAAIAAAASASSGVAPRQAAAQMPDFGAALRGMGAVDPVAQAVATVRAQPAGAARECLTTLTKVIDNIVAHPTEDKYRKIKRANAGFRRKVGGLPGGEACMRALGFVEADTDQGGSWLLNPSAAAWNVLTAGRVQIQSALATLPASGGPASAGSASRGTGSSAGFAAGLGELPAPGSFPPGGFGGGRMGMGGGMPDMAAMARMAQDPAMMQGMMNDPSVQAMMRGNPQMAAAMQSVMANPERMSQAFDMMQNNPGMAQMAQRMMQDPTALQRASQMDLGGALAAGISAGTNAGQAFQPPSTGAGRQGGFPAAAPPAAPAAATPSPPPVGGGRSGAAEGEGQDEMTEDELVAEAIRRSMEEN